MKIVQHAPTTGGFPGGQAWTPPEQRQEGETSVFSVSGRQALQYQPTSEYWGHILLHGDERP